MTFIRVLFTTFLIYTLPLIAHSQCGGTATSSLIPNPSFESYSSCPTGDAQMTNATSWIQASSGTSDYFNCTNSNLAAYNPPPTLPSANGTGYIGYLDNTSGYKEYVGSCLSSPLLAGTSYTIQYSHCAATGSGTLFTGNSSLSTTMVLYGSTNCSNLPFAGSGCPSTGWTPLSTNAIVTSTAWGTFTMTFTPTANIYAVILGSSCTVAPTGGLGGTTNYYYLDNLVLNTTTSFTPPTANAGPNRTTTCSSPSASLAGSASGGTPAYSYSWNNGAGTSATPSVNPSSNTNYTLTVTDQNGCTDTDVVLVTVNKSSPTANAGPNRTTTCNTPTANLAGSGGGSYSWNNGASTSATPTVNPGTNTNYTLTVTGSNGCTDTDVTTVTVNKTIPIANAGSDQVSQCSPPDVTLNGSASTGTGISYSWSGPSVVSGVSSSSAVADAAGNYTLTVTGSNGCVDTDIVAVTNTTNYPIADAGSTVTLDCNNASISLDGTGSDAGATISYSWSTTTGNIVSSGTTTSPVINSDGPYILTVTNSSNGCTSTDQTTVTYDTITPIVNLSSSSFIIDCTNTTATFDASATSGTGNTFLWSTSDGNIVSGNNSDSPVVNSDGTYALSVTSANGCNNIVNTNISVTYDTVTPSLNINLPDTLHCNQSQITIDASNSSSGLTYTWATIDGTFVSGDQSSTPIVSNIGTYYLNAVAANGCQNTDSITVIDNENPMAYAIANITEGEVDLDVVFSDTSTGLNLTYLWDFGNGDTDTISPSNYTFTEVQLHEVILTVTDHFGCEHSDTLEVNALELSAVEVPNIFTPNGDGDNDYFNVRGGGIKNITGNVMNRWGQIVYEWDSQYGGWDGYSVTGNEASEGTYFYFINIDFNDGHTEEYTGHFMLKR